MLEQTRKASNTKKTAWAGAIVIALAFLTASFWRSPSKRIPDDLLGEWRTEDPNYADRSFEIDPVCITFVTGGGTVSTGFIEEVKVVAEGGRALYTISYTADGQPLEVSFYYDLTKGKTIRFKNEEKIVWTKAQGS